ncbi:MAG TPA: hypothetical protein VF395_03895, partial [Polyangiaceae bacterium]
MPVTVDDTVAQAALGARSPPYLTPPVAHDICWFVTEKRTGPMTRLPQSPTYATHATHAVGVWSVGMHVV